MEIPEVVLRLRLRACWDPHVLKSGQMCQKRYAKGAKRHRNGSRNEQNGRFHSPPAPTLAGNHHNARGRAETALWVAEDASGVHFGTRKCLKVARCVKKGI